MGLYRRVVLHVLEPLLSPDDLFPDNDHGFLGDFRGNRFDDSHTVLLSLLAAGVTIALTFIAAYVIWSESPLRAMFTDVPEGIFPKFLLKKQPDGTLRNPFGQGSV